MICKKQRFKKTIDNIINFLYFAWKILQFGEWRYDMEFIAFDGVLNAVYLLLVIIGGLFAGFQWQVSNKIKRAEFINEIIEKLSFDRDLARTMYMIEYINYQKKSWYDENFHSGSETEFDIDKLLSYLSYICYLKKTKNIKNEEFKFMQYEIVRVCSSLDVQAYLWNLYHASRFCKSNCSFEHLIEYGLDQQNNLFHECFLDDKSGYYVKRMKF